MADTLQSPGLAESIEELIHLRCKCPVVFIDKESKYFPSIYPNHYGAVKQLINHLIEDHGYTDIAQKRFSILLYTIVKNIDQIYGTNEYSLSEKHKYLCFLRAELREALSNYRKYGWASLSHNRTAYVNSFRGTGFLRQVWLHKIKPLVHKG